MLFKISATIFVFLSVCKLQFVNCECEKYEVISDCIYYDLSGLPGNDNVTFICAKSRGKQVFVDSERIQCSNTSPAPANDWPGTVDFQHCRFDEMPKISFFEKFLNMHTFIMSGVNLEKISASSFRKATNVVNINFAKNRLEEIPPVAFVNAQKLKTLDFSENVIERMDLLAFLGLNELEALDLSHNNLTRLEEQIFKDLSNLKHLNLSHNQINGLEPNILTLPNLLELDLVNNDVTALDGDVFNQLVRLKRLNLSFNPITVLKHQVFLHLFELEHLSLRRTNLSSIAMSTFAHQQNLISLDLSGNSLTTMNFRLFLPILPGLTTLQLASNEITELHHFRNSLVPQLQHFNIQNNNFNCSYLEEFMESVNWQKMRMPIDLNLVNFQKANIRGVNCNTISETNKFHP